MKYSFRSEDGITSYNENPNGIEVPDELIQRWGNTWRQFWAMQRELEEWDEKEYNMRHNHSINGYDLICDGYACPEAYIVKNGEKKVGYIRIRHGIITVWEPDVLVNKVAHKNIIGDGYLDERERNECLTWAVDELDKYLKNKN
jgi:hypothetical protein